MEEKSPEASVPAHRIPIIDIKRTFLDAVSAETTVFNEPEDASMLPHLKRS